MTREREQRIEQVTHNRFADLTVIFENVDDPHNIAACLRSCDSVGVQEVFILSRETKKSSSLSRKASASAAKWLTIHHYNDAQKCFEEVRKKYHKIFSTHLSSNSVGLYEMNFNQPLALVFGNEHDGVSPEALQLSDGNFQIPQMGMIKSLNISVACAVTLYEALRQRRFLV